jgi:2-polyprenyl-3-methyl-5-hydroxy-6-metoxy-1,4-benzoquinol methylase
VESKDILTECCFICGSNLWKDVFSSKEYPEFVYKRCKQCKFIQLHPVPSDDQLRTFYEKAWSNNARGAYKDRYLSLKVSNEMKKYLNWYNSDLLNIENILQNKTRETVNFLEVGVGAGYMMAAVTEIGWNCVGIDISEAGVNNLKEQGFNVVLGNFCSNTEELKAETFDIIHMNHVLEHLRDPNIALSKVKLLLKPGGIFWAAVPTIDESLFSLTYRPWNALYKLSGSWNGFHPFFWCFYSIAHISCYSAKLFNQLIKSSQAIFSFFVVYLFQKFWR